MCGPTFRSIVLGFLCQPAFEKNEDSDLLAGQTAHVGQLFLGFLPHRIEHRSV
jgi:hypothetical protein